VASAGFVRVLTINFAALNVSTFTRSNLALLYENRSKKEIVIAPINSISCRYCNSDKIAKKAVRRNKQNSIQRFLCKECGRRFSFNIGFERIHLTPQIVTSALQLYFTGESFRNVQKFLKLQGVKITHVAVYKWIRRYVNLMETYLARITPNVSNVWRTDELYLKVKDNLKYLYAVMDDDTRFWIGTAVSKHQKYCRCSTTFRGCQSNHRKTTEHAYQLWRQIFTSRSKKNLQPIGYQHRNIFVTYAFKATTIIRKWGA
jgi:transposase-like protein